MSAANWSCWSGIQAEEGITHYFAARTNSVNSCSSAWFKSDTAQYFMPLFVQEETLYPRRVAVVGGVLRLVDAGVMNRLIGCLFRW